MTTAKEQKGYKFGDMDEEEKARICFNFTVGDPERREFYSPLFNLSGGTYPNNTECIKRITAPLNHMVRLEFRDQFHLEESPSCEFDKLEVHNGGHGYSPLAGTFCGREFPKPIQSEGRELYLKFTSDASIEYVGFKAVYSFIPAPRTEVDPPECKFNRDGENGRISYSDISNGTIVHANETLSPIDCTWTIRVQNGSKIYITFLHYELAQPNNCQTNFLDIISGGAKQDRLSHFCGTIAEPTTSVTNEVQIRFFAQGALLKQNNKPPKLEVLYTAFREVNDPKDCNALTEFSCDDGWCISNKLTCDGDYNCKYRYDEDASRCAVSSGIFLVLTSDHMIIILVVFTALVMGMCASITITCYNKIQERREREREYKIRRSKEVSMEIGLAPPAAPSSELEAALAAEIRLRKQHQTGQLAGQLAPMGGQLVDDVEDGRYLPDHPNGVLIMAGSGPVCGGGGTDGDRQSLGDRQSVKSVPLCPQHGHGTYRDNALDRDSLTPPIPPPPPPPLQAYYRMRDSPANEMSGRWSPLEDSTMASSPQGPSQNNGGETGRPDLVAHR
ncbi:neuropilin and tolloid protein 2-like [Tropilaelaps mercedesae]|uniref:Neuropilin and tolloid protein 2-like n=1 Tax=Tropilaelaps mercedesae TaxID=418985 RepID=A0A1V9XTM1_9ACAR|nr:neuropilin and tolloid protein 2-like [Tropilaelaps mercedesae]